MKDEFRIAVIFRRSTAYSKNVTVNAPTGFISLFAKRCDIVALLSEYNVQSYMIVYCSAPHNIMKDFEDIPDFYYKKD